MQFLILCLVRQCYSFKIGQEIEPGIVDRPGMVCDHIHHFFWVASAEGTGCRRGAVIASTPATGHTFSPTALTFELQRVGVAFIIISTSYATPSLSSANASCEAWVRCLGKRARARATSLFGLASKLWLLLQIVSGNLPFALQLPLALASAASFSIPPPALRDIGFGPSERGEETA